MSLTIGSLFSGIGGFELGLEWAGLGPTLWQVEKDPFCREVLARHWPEVKRYEEIERVTSVENVDVICGGFPCQDVSSAGRGAGLDGARSGLWWEFARVVDLARPRYVIVENVASGARRWLPAVRRSLHLHGYASTAFALSAADVGAPHRRKRIFVLAYSDGEPLRVDQQWEPARRAHGVLDQGHAESSHDGGARPAADADREGELREQGSGDGRRRRVGDGACAGRRGWPSVAPVCGVAYGIPDWVERLAALGNAIVPQCAEVIGRVILERERILAQ